MLANCYGGLGVERRGVKPNESDRDALGLAYRLPNVHTHLLAVVGPRGIQSAGRV